MKSIVERLTIIKEEMHEFESRYGREPDSVKLLAVSKTKPLAAIQAAHAAGQRDFGENYLQEALEKIENTQDLPLIWHFIGPVQSNKTKQIASHFDWCHSVDRLKIAQRLSDARPEHLPPLNICIQVNISGEASKSGIDPDGLDALVADISGLKGIALRGLMALPQPEEGLASQRAACHALLELFDKLRGIVPGIDTLSMGTSADFEAAIAEGSTLVRVGTALFGPRE